MSHPKRMLLANRAWSHETTLRDPAFFSRLAEGQQPRVLWIGCSDSRVPAEQITNARAGELFVHRNIANLVTCDDGNASSVLEYAVHVLNVEDIVVCGHHCCGGVRAALSEPSDMLPRVNQRISVIRDVADQHREELERIDDFDARADRLAQLNVTDQVRRLRESPIVCGARQVPRVHGWIFELREGLLMQLTDDGESHRHARPPASAYAGRHASA